MSFSSQVLRRGWAGRSRGSWRGCGHPLIINARGVEELGAAERELSQFTRVVAVAGDVSEVAEEIAARGIEEFGRVDVLINNASDIGPSPMPPLELYPWEALLRLFKVNAVAPLHLIQLLLPGMRARGHGMIVNITSDAAVNAYAGWGGYGASKAALEHLSRVWPRSWRAAACACWSSIRAT